MFFFGRHLRFSPVHPSRDGIDKLAVFAQTAVGVQLLPTRRMSIREQQLCYCCRCYLSSLLSLLVRSRPRRRSSLLPRDDIINREKNPKMCSVKGRVARPPHYRHAGALLPCRRVVALLSLSFLSRVERRRKSAPK